MIVFMKLTYEELEKKASLLEKQLADKMENIVTFGEQQYFAVKSCDEANDFIIWTDIRGKICFANQALCHRIGIKKSELLSKQVFTFYQENSNLPWYNIISRLSEAESLVYENNFITISGEIFPVEIKLNKLKYIDKEYFCIVAKELTEKKTAEETIAELDGKFRSITAASPNPLLITRYSDGKLLYANERCADLASIEASKLLEKFTPEFYDNFEARQAYVAELNKGPVKNWEVRLWREDGSHLWALANARMGEFEKEKAIYIGLMDITEWKSTEHALRESEYKYEQVISMISDIIWQYETDKDGKFYDSYISPVADKLLGVPLGTIANSFGKYLSFVNKEDNTRIEGIFKSIINGQEQEFTVEYRLHRPDNTVIWVSTNGSAHQQSNGRIIVYGTTTDITKRELAEEALRLSEERFILFMHNFPGLAYIKDSAGRVIFANEGFNTLLGIDYKSMTGKSTYELFQKDFADKIDEDDQRVIMSGKPETIEEDFGGKNWITKKFPFASSESNTMLGGFTIEITDLKRTEAALRESEEKYRLLFENAGEAILVVQDGIIVLVNKSCKDLIGYTDTDLISKTITNFIHPEDKQLVMDRHIQRLMGETLPGRYSFRLVHSSGEPIWAEINTVLISWQDKPATLSFLTDITERKHAEEELLNKNSQIESQYEEYMQLNEKLRITNYNLELAKERAEESERQLHLIANNFVNGMLYQVITNGENERKFNYISNAVEKLYGCTVEEAKENANLIYGRIHPDDIIELIHKEREAIQNESIFECEARVFNPDNSIRWSYYISRPRVVNGVQWWDGIEVDITERKKIELELRHAKEKAEESETQFRRLFDNMEQGFALHEMIYDGNGIPVDYRFVLTNKAFGRLTGADATTFIGKTVRELLPRIENIWIENYGKVALTGIPMHFENYTVEFNKYYDVIAYSPKKDFFAVVFTDITQNKIYERELITAKEKAEESDKLKSAFLANISHEIRTPLNAILGFGSLMNDTNLTTDERNEYFNIIKTRSDDLLDIIGDILDISKIEANQLSIHFSSGKISTMMNELYSVYDLRRVTDRKNNISFNLINEINDKHFSIITDFNRVKQVLGNLLNNAFKFTSSGEISYGCRLVNDNQILFFVSDTGIGIPEDKLDKIFDRFRQVELEVSKQFGGTGLGLSISKGLVELLSGKIWVESKLNEGSAFYFTIPFNPSENNSNAFVKSETKAAEFSNKKVLIVEDDPNNLKYIEKLLEIYNLDFISATNGNSAMKSIFNHPEINLVMMDIQLPDISGYELTRWIKKNHNNISIIAQTGFAMEEDRIRCLEAGCDDFIAKPLVKEELYKKIKRLLS